MLYNSENSSVLVSDRDGLRTITINNPRKKNALNKNAYMRISDELNKAAEDDSVVVVAVTGVGEFFSSGNDIKENFANLEKNINNSTTLRKFIHAFIRFPKLLIAVVNGPAIGIGATILPLFDVVYASDTAYFYTPFVKLGISSEACSSYTFPKILGKSKASEMLLLNHKMYAKEAFQFKFISAIFSSSELDTKIWPKIQELTKLSKESLGVCKKLNQANEIDVLIKVCERELAELKERRFSPDNQAYIKTFIDRKKAKL